MPTNNPVLAIPLVLTIGLVWWSQGWIFPRMLIFNTNNDKNLFRPLLAIYICVFVGITFALADQLHQSLADYNIKAAIFIILWYPLAMQFLRYCHLLVVGKNQFIKEFGLNYVPEEQHLRLFIRVAPTIIFAKCHNTSNGINSTGDNENNNNNTNNNAEGDNTNDAIKKKNDDYDPSSTTTAKAPPPLPTLSSKTATDNNNNSNHLKTMLLDLVWIVVICSSVLIFRMGEWLPDFVQRILRVYIMGLSTSILRLIHEYPVISMLPSKGATLVPLYDQPYLTKSPRELWRRWSITAGYHLRKAFYDPVLEAMVVSFIGPRHLRETANKKFDAAKNNDDSSGMMMMLLSFVAAAVPFFVNCVMHIYWWSMGVKGEIDHVYWILLFAYPLFSFAVEDIVGQVIFGTRRAKTWPHHAVNLSLLWGGFYMVGERMAYAHDLNSDLTEVCRANLLLPPSKQVI